MDNQPVVFPMRLKTVTLFLLALLSAGVTARTETPPDSSRRVRVLTFNILHGATTNNDFDLEVIARVIREANPDFVALQEVDFLTGRARNLDLATELAWRTKMAPLFAGAMKFDGGEYGNAILSRHTFIGTRKVALPFTGGREPRVAVEITTILPSGDTIAFVGTHLDSQKDEKDRIAQAKNINEVFASNHFPTILAGDLNAMPGSVPVNLLEELWMATYDKGNPEPTFPSVNPMKKIDYVMCWPKNRWKVMESKVIPDAVASDHCAYLVVLELRGGDE